ncbi:hypothetical protein KEM48_004007 [Puccinia striiformis f. sp. tritici PST-130]|nr:hypothetical protein Pst134EB_014825 [Puccinia striiformis f. sp. tritici]KAI9612931.1 hypothetical protein KEM48_004007 [Puccinia striiformis f. sp. tritici PST-130]
MSNSQELGERSQEIYSVVRVFQDMSRKYVFPPHHEVSADQDPNLTIEDVATKSEILKKIQCNLLPAIKGHIISLLKALYDLDKEYPHPDIDLTLGILSDLDQTLQTTTSSILTLADESPLPHAKHDHRMEKLKIYRCLELRWKIKRIIDNDAADLLNGYGEFMQSWQQILRRLGSRPHKAGKPFR